MKSILEKMSIIRIIIKLNVLLARRQKVKVVILALMMIIGGFMEMLSVSFIMPLIEMMMSPETIKNNRIVLLISGYLGVFGTPQILTILSTLLAVLYIVKNVYLVIEIYFQNQFVYNNMADTQKKIYSTYIHLPYEFYLDLKSGEVLRIINEDTRNAFGLLTSILTFFTEAIVSIILVITVLFISPSLTMQMSVLLIVMVLAINAIVKPILRKAGRDNVSSLAQMNQWILQTVQGIKEIKVMQCEDSFEKRYEQNIRQFSHSQRVNATLGILPRYLIEAFAMGALLLLMSISIYRGADLREMVVILSGFAMAAIRLLPAVNKISLCLTDIAYREIALDKVLETLSITKKYDLLNKDEIREIRKENRVITDENNFMECVGITFKYPSSKEAVLKNINVLISMGEAVGIIGPSGSGKTTFVDIILGLLKPEEGKVVYNGMDISEERKEWLSIVSYIPQNIFIIDGSVRDNVAFGYDLRSVEDADIWRALEEAALGDYIRSLPNKLDTQLGERGISISGGQKQRVGIARALYKNPKVLVFDEATSALDNETEKEIIRAINGLQGKVTMIIIAHRLSTIEHCDTVYEISDSKIKRIERANK